MKTLLIGSCLALLAFGPVLAEVEDDLPSIAVVGFDCLRGNHCEIAEQLAEYLQGDLVGTDRFSVVERSKLANVLLEQDLSGSGFVPVESAVKMGRLLGARYIMTGKVLRVDQEERKFSGYGVQTRTTIFTLAVRVQVIDTERAQVVFSETAEGSITEHAGSGLSAYDSGVYGRLTRDLSGKIAKQLARSSRFAPSEATAVEFVNVEFSSSPARADVEIDGVFYGNTDGSIEVPTGLHTVRISLAGRTPWEKKVLLRAGSKVHAELGSDETAALGKDEH